MDDLQTLQDELDHLKATFEVIRGNIARVEDMPRAMTELQQENRALRLMLENVLTRLVKVERTVNAPGLVPQQQENVG